MKVLLDEALPHALRTAFSDHEVVTVGYAGWAQYRNGDLIRRATEAGFQVRITPDRGYEHQHNVPMLGLALVIISGPTITMGTILPLVPDIQAVLDSEPEPGTLTMIGSHRLPKGALETRAC